MASVELTMTEQFREPRTSNEPPPRAADKESWLLRTGLSISVWTLAGVATILAATGQAKFARWAGIADIRAYAVPAVLELVAVAFLLIGYRRARRGDSASMLWLLAAVVGGFAVYTNVVHTGGRSGLVFGAASAITMLLWFVKLRDDYRHFQRHTGQATRPRPKLGVLWLVAPRLSTRAWVVATRPRVSTVDEAVGYAEVWRAVYADAPDWPRGRPERNRHGICPVSARPCLRILGRAGRHRRLSRRRIRRRSLSAMAHSTRSGPRHRDRTLRTCGNGAARPPSNATPTSPNPNDSTRGRPNDSYSLRIIGPVVDSIEDRRP